MWIGIMIEGRNQDQGQDCRWRWGLRIKVKIADKVSDRKIKGEFGIEEEKRD
jgi:hypothetical protein